MTPDQLAAEFLRKATNAEVEKEQEIKNSRLSKLDAFRGLMLKAGLTYTSVSIPLFLSAKIHGLAKVLFGISLVFSIIMTLLLVVLILKGPRQLGEAYDQYVLWILSCPNRGAFSYNPKETKLERLATISWPYVGFISLIAMLAAICLKAFAE